MYIGLTHASIVTGRKSVRLFIHEDEVWTFIHVTSEKGELIFFSAQNEEGPKVKQERLRVHLVVRGGSISC